MIPLYILDDETPEDRKLGGASRWWLHHALESLEKDLGRHGSRLILRRGSVCDVLPELAKESGAKTVHALRHYEPWWRRAQGKLKDQLDLQLHDGNYLLPPGSVTTGAERLTRFSPPSRIRCSPLSTASTSCPNPAFPAPKAGRKAIRLTISACCRPSPTGLAVWLSSGAASTAPPPLWSGSISSWMSARTTPTIAICRARMPPAACRRTCTTAKSARACCGTRWAAIPARAHACSAQN